METIEGGIYILTATGYNFIDGEVEPSIQAAYRDKESAYEDMLKIAYETARDTTSPEDMETLKANAFETRNGYMLVVEHRTLEIGTVYKVERVDRVF